MRRATLVAVIAASAAVMAGALAQDLDGFDAATVRARAAALQAEAALLAAEVERRGTEFRQDAETVREAALARVRAVDATQLPAGPQGAIDFDALIGAASANLDPRRGGAPLLIAFVSLSMPQDALRAVIRDVGRAGGAVVFRGFPDNSAKAFVAGLARVVDDQAQLASIGIDPRLFRAFDVRAVPAYVVAATDFELCDGLACRSLPPPHDLITGNVTVDYALSAIAEGSGPGARVAAVALTRLRGAGS